MSRVGETVTSRVRTYDQHVARYLHTYGQQELWLSSEKVDLALVVGKGEVLRHFVVRNLNKCNEPLHLGAKTRYNV